MERQRELTEIVDNKGEWIFPLRKFQLTQFLPFLLHIIFRELFLVTWTYIFRNRSLQRKNYLEKSAVKFDLRLDKIFNVKVHGKLFFSVWIWFLEICQICWKLESLVFFYPMDFRENIFSDSVTFNFFSHFCHIEHHKFVFFLLVQTCSVSSFVFY